MAEAEGKVYLVDEAPKVIVPIYTAPLSPGEAAEGEDTVTMVFDIPVMLTLDNGQRISFPQGTHEVARRYADHWFLKAHGARLYAKPVAAGKPAAKPAA